MTTGSFVDSAANFNRYRTYDWAGPGRIEGAETTYNSYSSCSFDCDDRVREYDTATMVVDVIDARSRKIVWRGWAEGGMNGVLDNQEWMEAHVDRTVNKIMAAFPRRADRAAN
jgi:hypothetical protein